MSSLSSFYLKKETLETLLKTVNAKGEKGVEITISISDEQNNYGQNVSGFVSQTKEQREAKKQRYFVGNGKVFWSDGKITVAKKEVETVQAEPFDSASNNDLPF
jgi:hypothetical protein